MRSFPDYTGVVVVDLHVCPAGVGVPCVAKGPRITGPSTSSGARRIMSLNFMWLGAEWHRAQTSVARPRFQRQTITDWRATLRHLIMCRTRMPKAIPQCNAAIEVHLRCIQIHSAPRLAQYRKQLPLGRCLHYAVHPRCGSNIMGSLHAPQSHAVPSDRQRHSG